MPAFTFEKLPAPQQRPESQSPLPQKHEPRGSFIRLIDRFALLRLRLRRAKAKAMETKRHRA